MKSIITTIVIMHIFVAVSIAQNSVAELPREQASALQQFLDQNPALEFMPEESYDAKEREFISKDIDNPYYLAHDFNHDGKKDFAVLLKKRGGPVYDGGAGMAETHRYEHELMIVIFNRMKDKKYKPVYTSTTKAPLVSFLFVTTDKPKILAFGVPETCNVWKFEPTRDGDGYSILGEPVMGEDEELSIDRFYSVGDIDILQFKKEYKKRYILIDEVLTEQGVNLNDLDSMTPDQLTEAFNKLIFIPNLIALLDRNKGGLERINTNVSEAKIRIKNKRKLAEIFPRSLEMEPAN